MGNLIMSPTWKISLIVLSTKLKDTMVHLCVMLTIQGLHSMSDFYPDPIIVISIISSFSLHFPSSYSLLWSIGGSISFLITIWFYFSTSWWGIPIVLTIVPQDSLPSLVNSFASVVDYHLLIEKLLNPFHVRLQLTIIHMAWIVLVLWDSLWRP